MVNGLRSLEKKLEGMKDDIEDEVDDAVERSLDATEREAKRNLVEQDAVASTATYRGFQQRKTTVGANGRRGFRRTLTNVAPHAKFVERGTGDKGFYRAPSMSTSLVNAIRVWINQKPSFRRLGRPDDEAAFWIARSIAGEGDGPSGTAPQPFMRPAWQRGERVLKHNVQVAVTRAVNL